MDTQVKFKLAFCKDNSTRVGAVCWDGYIEINIEYCNEPIKFLFTLIHELIHWTLDAFSYPINGVLHEWNEIVCIIFFPYRNKVNRKELFKQVRNRIALLKELK